MIANRITVQVFSVSGIIFEAEDIISLNVRITDGRLLGIRPGHAKLIAATQAGPLTYQTETTTGKWELTEGILMVERNHVKVLMTR